MSDIFYFKKSHIYQDKMKEKKCINKISKHRCPIRQLQIIGLTRIICGVN